MSTSFEPLELLAGGHRQTLSGFWFRRQLSWSRPTQDVVVDAGDDVRLLVRTSWQPGPRQDRPMLLSIHGLGGGDDSTYGLATAQVAWARGWHVARMNMRSAGDSASVCARLYNAGLDQDLIAVLEHFSGCCSRIGVAGFSLGANLALLACGRRPESLPDALKGVVAICPPVDLTACVEALERPSNRFYQAYFTTKLREAYRLRQSLRPDLYEPGREKGLSTVRAYDERITAPYGGYPSASSYYEESSSGPWLRLIQRPTLLLASADDPMVPVESVTRWELPASGVVQREITTTGGHVGFVGRATSPGRFWAAKRGLDFLDSVV